VGIEIVAPLYIIRFATGYTEVLQGGTISMSMGKDEDN